MWSANLLRGAICFSFAALLPAAVSTRSQEPSSAPTQSIRVRVDRVDVGVIVTDSQGKFVGGLRRDDFHIFDDGVEQPITDFAPVDEPAQVFLLVEAGPSVYFLQAGHVSAAHALLEGLSIGDRVAVAKYDATPQLLLDFTENKPAAEAALEKVRYYVGFGTLNLSRSLSTVIDWLGKVQGKKTIVLLSTGFDTSAPAEASNLISRLKITDVRVLAISLGAELRNPSPNSKNKKQPQSEKSAITQQGFAEADRLLSLLTQTTGGRVYFPTNPKDFASAYAEIAELVRHEYSLAFALPVRDGKSHTIEVRVSGSLSAAASATPDTCTYRVDNRNAYVAPKE